MKLAENTFCEFIEKLSSKSPTPGGGGASALLGSVGTALSGMVANLTICNKKFTEYRDEIEYMLNKSRAIQTQFLELMDKDAENFLPFIKAFGLPKLTEEEKKFRENVMQKCLKNACTAPIEIMEKCLEALEVHEYFVDHCSKMIVSDIGVGVQSLRSALLGAHLSVIININSIKDSDYTSKIKRKVNLLVKEGTAKADMIYEKVCTILSK
ncbi:sugar ABC transporter substrate-binding protein [Clostridium fermenticellae]|uniref:Sugar ABC transporter substrate-binding protein n=1 Tax=Clostridium fermenticellae TaxID=2068654 RepID=A0A386H4X7_9CLOT|nr:cyclodeaminase/cyclohydrolase family protein [Clostridium fermenticellae]AYD40797.1 sugar ABC transporter substrate-binding protein [Clostridium fermenticellae]